MISNQVLVIRLHAFDDVRQSSGDRCDLLRVNNA